MPYLSLGERIKMSEDNNFNSIALMTLLITTTIHGCLNGFKTGTAIEKTDQINRCLLDFSQCASGGDSARAVKVRELLASTDDTSKLTGQSITDSKSEHWLRIDKVYESRGHAGKSLCADYNYKGWIAHESNTACIPDPKIAALGSAPLPANE
jgi:hypothetical protein